MTAEVKTGHCYLAYNSDKSGRVITLFHVVVHNKSYSVKINEIEVLDKRQAVLHSLSVNKEYLD